MIHPWNNQTEYRRGNRVEYLGKLWLCKRGHTGMSPLEGFYWQIFTQTPIIVGEWNASAVYAAQQVVQYATELYRCQVTNVNKLPSDPHYWTKVYVPLVSSQSNILYVDGSRLDDYISDGTILRPYKYIESAWETIENPTDLNRYAVYLHPARYILTDLQLKPFVSLIGVGADPCYIQCSGEITAPSSMTGFGACLTNLLLECTSSDAWALRIANRGNVSFKDVAVFSTSRGLLLEGDSFGWGSGLGIMSVGDALSVTGTAFMGLEHCPISCAGAPARDVFVDTDAYIYMDDATWFQGDLVEINGTIMYGSNASQLVTSSGATVQEVLDASVPLLPGDGDYTLRVVNGVGTWVAV